MTERPILFSAPMVRAILEGRKSQTRRVADMSKVDAEFAKRCSDHAIVLDGYSRFTEAEKEQEVRERILRYERNEVGLWAKFAGLASPGSTEPDVGLPWVKCPYGQPGDRLWVRETWAPALDGSRDGVYYDADHQFRERRCKSPIHMPRWASRILLEVTDVRVERLQAISEEDARGEGVERHLDGWFPYGIKTWLTTLVDGKEVPVQVCRDARTSFEMLWESINGPGSWDANPWVWAITFRRLEPRP